MRILDCSSTRQSRRSPDPFLYGRTGNGGHAVGAFARRRVYNAIVHLCIDSERICVTRRCAGIRRRSPDTLNIDESLIERAITPRTKAIAVVHYGGVCCEMDQIQAIASQHGLAIVEDAAPAFSSTYRGKPAGLLSSLACFSFHETKNLVSGEGGAIVINDAHFLERADIIREKGTNRVQFRSGLVDKYTWVDIGSSYLPAEIVAAYLWAQLEAVEEITARRRCIWARYHTALEPFERMGRLRRPIVPQHCIHNGHLYYILMRDRADRDRAIESLREDGIMAPFHYVPLHSGAAGKQYGRASGALPFTTDASERLIRLPLFESLGEDQNFVIERTVAYLNAHS